MTAVHAANTSPTGGRISSGLRFVNDSTSAKPGSNIGRTSPLSDVSERILARPESQASGRLLEHAVSLDESGLDHSKTVNPVHKGFRSNTVAASRRDKRVVAAEDRVMHDIFEQGFSRSIRTLGKGILEDVRTELREALFLMHKDMSTSLDEHESKREAAVGDSLSELVRTMREVREETLKPPAIDFIPVTSEVDKLREYLENRDSHHSEMQQSFIEKFESYVAESITSVVDGIKVAMRHQEQEQSTELLQLRDELVKVRAELSSLAMSSGTSLQQAIAGQNASAVEEIRKIQADMERRQDELIPFLRNEFSHSMKEHVVGLEPVISEVAQLQASKDFSVRRMEEILGEIGKVQRALHTDFFHDPDDPDAVLQDGVRVREFYAQTDHPGTSNASVQAEIAEPKKKDRPVIRPKQIKSDRAVKTKPTNVIDGDAMKARMQEELLKGEYNVSDYYHKSGCAVTIATSKAFDIATFAIIFANVIWIAIDLDSNSADLLLDAHPVFQIVENIFCAWFTFEIVVRFLAFNGKRHAFRDFWFNFDLFLVSLMIIETWLLTVIIWAMGGSEGASLGTLSMLRTARLVKIGRMARMARVLRSIPELVVLVKTIGVASRSVLFFFVFWMIIMYVFGVAFRQITKDTTIGDQYFASVPDAMNSLLLHGILPMHSTFVNDLASSEPVLWPLAISFILLAALTVMNMLVGVLVEVVGVVAGTEKDKLSILYVKYQLEDAMYMLGLDTNMAFPREDFARIIMYPEMLRVMQNVGVDPTALADTASLIFDDLERDMKGTDTRPGLDEIPVLSFETFIDTVLKLRGKNIATVKDVKEQTRVMKFLVGRLEESFESMINNMNKEFVKLILDQHASNEMTSGANEHVKKRTVILDDDVPGLLRQSTKKSAPRFTLMSTRSMTHGSLGP